MTQISRDAKAEIGRAGEKTCRTEGRTPMTLGLVRDRQIDSSLLQNSCGLANQSKRVLRRRQAIQDCPNAHVSEIFVVPHLRIQHDRPTDCVIASRNPVAQESLAAGRIQQVQGFAISNSEHRVAIFAILPYVVGPSCEPTHALCLLFGATMCCPHTLYGPYGQCANSRPRRRIHQPSAPCALADGVNFAQKSRRVVDFEKEGQRPRSPTGSIQDSRNKSFCAAPHS